MGPAWEALLWEGERVPATLRGVCPGLCYPCRDLTGVPTWRSGALGGWTWWRRGRASRPLCSPWPCAAAGMLWGC